MRPLIPGLLLCTLASSFAQEMKDATDLLNTLMTGSEPMPAGRFTMDDLRRMIDGRSRGILFNLKGQVARAGETTFTLEQLQRLLSELEQGNIRAANFSQQDLERMVNGTRNGIRYNYQGAIASGTEPVMTIENLNNLLRQLVAKGPMRLQQTSAKFNQADIQKMLNGMDLGLRYNFNGEPAADGEQVLTRENLNQLLSQLNAAVNMTTTVQFTRADVERMLAGMGRGLFYNYQGKVAVGNEPKLTREQLLQILNQLNAANNMMTSVQFTRADVERMLAGMERGLFYNYQGKEAVGNEPKLTREQLLQILNQLNAAGTLQTANFTRTDLERMINGTRNGLRYNYQGTLANGSEPVITLERLNELLNKLNSIAPMTGANVSRDFSLADIETMLRGMDLGLRYNFKGETAAQGELALTRANLIDMQNQLKGGSGMESSTQGGNFTTTDFTRADIEKMLAGMDRGLFFNVQGKEAGNNELRLTREQLAQLLMKLNTAVGGSMHTINFTRADIERMLVGMDRGLSYNYQGREAVANDVKLTREQLTQLLSNLKVSGTETPIARVVAGRPVSAAEEVNVVDINLLAKGAVSFKDRDNATVATRSRDEIVRINPSANRSGNVTKNTENTANQPGFVVADTVSSTNRTGILVNENVLAAISSSGPVADDTTSQSPTANLDTGTGSLPIQTGTSVVRPGSLTIQTLETKSNETIGSRVVRNESLVTAEVIGSLVNQSGISIMGTGTAVIVPVSLESGTSTNQTGQSSVPTRSSSINTSDILNVEPVVIKAVILPDVTIPAETSLSLDKARTPTMGGGSVIIENDITMPIIIPTVDQTELVTNKPLVTVRGSGAEQPTTITGQTEMSVPKIGLAANLTDRIVRISEIDVNKTTIAEPVTKPGQPLKQNEILVGEPGSIAARTGVAEPATAFAVNLPAITVTKSTIVSNQTTVSGMERGSVPDDTKLLVELLKESIASQPEVVLTDTGAITTQPRVEVSTPVLKRQTETSFIEPGSTVDKTVHVSTSIARKEPSTVLTITVPLLRQTERPFTKSGLLIVQTGPIVTPRPETGITDAAFNGAILPDWLKSRVDPAPCRQFNCNLPICYVPHATDCKSYIVCQRTAIGTYVAWKMRCAFGSYWGTGRHWTCERVEELAKQGYTCPNDPCMNATLTTYADEDENCRTYWTCENRMSKPACCPNGQRFDKALLRCVKDQLEICRAPCPLKIAGCSVQGARTMPFYDGNCKTYWDCENGFPHPVCCQNGFSYDPHTGVCAEDSSCIAQCPPQYSGNVCGKITGNSTVHSYALTDGNCRTYMRCGSKGVGYVEPYCCRQEYKYNVATGQCEHIEDITDPCNQEICPQGYKEDCRFTTIKDRPKQFYDTDAGIVRDCAPGTTFAEHICTCEGSSFNHICKAEVLAKFDEPQDEWSVKNYGDGWLSTFGALKKNKTAQGVTYGSFDGSSGIEAWRYDHTAFPEVTVEIIFMPVTNGAGKQILLSNCMAVDSNSPSFEISLEPQTSLVVITAKSKFGSAELAVPYTKQEWNKLNLYYDGDNVVTAVTEPNSTTNGNVQSKALKGAIVAGVGALKFGPCLDSFSMPMSNGFTGFISEIKLTRCIDTDGKDFIRRAVKQLPKNNQVH